MLCAFAHPGDEETINPDSGGLLLVRRPDGSYALAGILSRGVFYDSVSNLGIFTKISAVNDWLVHTMTA